MILLELFWTFFKIGAFTFGGGYAMLPLIQQKVIDHGWMEMEQLVDFVAISESTPGPIMVNMATYVGYDQAGFLGSVIATIAVVLPAYLVILLVLGILKNTIQNKYVQAVLRGLKPCVTGIVLATGLYMVIHNCVTFHHGVTADLRAGVLTILLVGVMVLYPKITKKKLDPKYEGYLHAAAMVLLLALMAIIMFKDIFTIFKG